MESTDKGLVLLTRGGHMVCGPPIFPPEIHDMISFLKSNHGPSGHREVMGHCHIPE